MPDLFTGSIRTKAASEKRVSAVVNNRADSRAYHGRTFVLFVPFVNCSVIGHILCTDIQTLDNFQKKSPPSAVIENQTVQVSFDQVIYQCSIFTAVANNR